MYFILSLLASSCTHQIKRKNQKIKQSFSIFDFQEVICLNKIANQLFVTFICWMAGALIVSTPQDVALIDARKGITMFSKVQVPVCSFLAQITSSMV